MKHSENLEIVLDLGQTLSGQVLDQHGQPAENALVRWGPYWGNVHHGVNPVRTDKQGRFLLSGVSLLTKSYREEVLQLGILFKGHAIHFEKPVSTEEDIVIQLEQEFTLSGQVVDAEGVGLADINVRIEGQKMASDVLFSGRKMTWERKFKRNKTRTDQAGFFKFDQLYEGPFIVSAFHPIQENLSAEVNAKAGDQNLKLVFDLQAMRKVILSGTVRDAISGHPITDFSVTPSIEGMGYPVRFKNADGSFEVDGLKAGEIELSIEAKGYATFRCPTADFELGEHKFDIMLDEERSVLLKVTNEEGQPALRNDLC